MKVKFKILTLLLTLILFFPINLNAAEKTKIYIEDVVKYENSNKVTVKIYLKNANSNIVALGINLLYDNSKLEVLSSKAGEDLNSILKHGEDFPSEGKFSMAMLSLSGFKEDGHYYSVIFNVKDNSNDIPLRLEVKEASDKDGNDVPVEIESGKIVISKANKENKENTQEEQKITDFSINDVDELTSIEDILTHNSDIKISEEDILSYEIENPDVIKVLEDGSLIANEDGKSKVKVKVNGSDIGTIDVEIENGNIKTLSGNDKVDKETYKEVVNDETINNKSMLEGQSIEKNNTKETIESVNNYNSPQFNKSITQSGKTDKGNKNVLIKVLVAFIIAMLLIFIFIKTKKQRRKKC